MKKQLDLYLDESGSFDEQEGKAGSDQENSMVGGLLIDPALLPDEKILELLPQPVHCRDYYDKGYLTVLEKIKEIGGQFVVFENKGRVHIVNSDITYLSIMTEGLVKLMRDLAIEFREGVSLRIFVATRKDMEAEKVFYSTVLKPEAYQTRLEEKLIIGYRKNGITGCDYELIFKDARYFRRSDFADIVCNTFKTRNRKKFSEDERKTICSLFEGQRYYELFEDALAVYLKQLLMEQHYSEAVCQICRLPKLTGYTGIRNKLLAEIERSDSYEQESLFGQISLIIGQYNRTNRYREGIRFAENYKRYFLDFLKESPNRPQSLPFWIFDTDYYLLTMYDHIGNVGECRRYLDLCHGNIGCVNRSWEHIDYYFGFCIREMNVLMGRFAFRQVLERSESLVHILKEAKELFGMIKTYDGMEQEIRSELLGKAYGVQIEAMINLLRSDPKLFEEAVKLSDAALDEFTDPRDISRQLQWRCLLMTEAKETEEAYRALLQAAEVPEEQDPVRAFLDRTYAMKAGTYDFLLWHYTAVMVLLKEKDDSRGAGMAKALLNDPRFKKDAADEKKTGHPWNLALWNVARYHRLCGNLPEYKNKYRRAMQITCEDKANTTMMTYALSLGADNLLWYRQKDAQHASTAEKDFMKIHRDLLKANLTEEMKSVFFIEEIDRTGKVTDQQLKKIAAAYLK